MVDRNWDPILGVRSDEGASAAPPRSSHERRRKCDTNTHSDILYIAVYQFIIYLLLI